MSCTLVVMAAGIGSRFGGGIKQLAKVGPSGEIILDYSIHDAIEAGFDRVVFVISHKIEKDFREVFGDRIERTCARKGVEVAYAFQSLEDLPAGFSLPEERQKPWGTGQAVLACKDLVSGPFAIINADDYYGKEPYRIVAEFLKKPGSEYCMAGFRLKNTLTPSGGVTRGLCHADEQGYLTDIAETKDIRLEPDGSIHAGETALSGDMLVSMNMFGFREDFWEKLEKGFTEFLSDPASDLVKGEYLVPIYVNDLLGRGEIRLKLLETSSRWFGMTYKEDTEPVRAEFRALVKAGEYPESLL